MVAVSASVAVSPMDGGGLNCHIKVQPLDSPTAGGNSAQFPHAVPDYTVYLVCQCPYHDQLVFTQR